MKIDPRWTVAPKMVFLIAFAAALTIPLPVALSPLDSPLLGPAMALAEEDWRMEFDDICSGTQDALSFSVDELKALVARADRLMPVLETLGDTERRVFVKRLRRCRDLYLFVIDEKLKEQ